MVDGIIPRGTENLKVANFLKPFGWNDEELGKVFPMDIIQKILPIHAGTETARDDRMIWGHSSTGDFLVSLSFSLVMADRNNGLGSFSGRSISPQELKAFFGSLPMERFYPMTKELADT